jgi:hypothetical protein
MWEKWHIMRMRNFIHYHGAKQKLHFSDLEVIFRFTFPHILRGTFEYESHYFMVKWISIWGFPKPSFKAYFLYVMGQKCHVMGQKKSCYGAK